MKKRITERILKVFCAATCTAVLARSYAADPTPKAGDLDLSFNPGQVMQREVNGIASGSVQAIACQPDGRILIAGRFDQAGGNTNCHNLTRLLANGKADAGFYSGLGPHAAEPLKSQVYVNFLIPAEEGKGGKYYVGGAYTWFDDVEWAGLVRILANGLLDPSFNPGPFDPSLSGLPSVKSLGFVEEGLVVGGLFMGQRKPLADRRQYNLEVLAFDGQIRTNYANSHYPVGGINVVLSLADGSILAGSPGSLAFLDGKGDYDDAHPERFLLVEGGVDLLVQQPDGKILVGGSFLTEIGGVSVNGLARLLPDGHLDTTFRPAVITSTANRLIRAVTLQPDGKILVGGLFDRVGGVRRYSLARLYPDGALDETFECFAVNDVNAIALQRDGKILVGESFWDEDVSDPYFQKNPMGVKRLHNYVIGPLIQPKFPEAPYNDACLTANMTKALADFEQRLGQEGARIVEKKSACRTVEYQAHLREIWEHAGALRNASGVRVVSEEPLQFALTSPVVTSASVVQEMNAEILDHWATSFPRSVAPPGPSAPHVRGIAVDWSIEEKQGLDLNALALACGLVRCVPGEKWHFQLANVPPPVRLVDQGRSPINILVQDPNGRRVGFDAVTGSAVNDLGPAASYSGPGSEPQQIEILPAAMLFGDYRISGVGTGSGAYTIAVQVFSEDDSGDVFEKVLATGIAQVGQPLAPIPSLDCMASVMRLLGWPSGRELMLVAPGWATNVVLESSPTALPGSWQRVPQTLDARHSLVVTNAGEPARFFRLAKP